ncbi:hypothetical protein BRAS3843_110004 [Bradyrhizobium sp. STM 3843]|nr:hypothetical protein BRAS3843_110004 [Bradyrhizobium sp. STM 3843]
MEEELSVNKNGNLRADGISLSVPTLFGRLGGTYYWNPGAPGTPPFTVTRSLGGPGFGAHPVHLRPGLSSQDTLGKGITGNLSVGIPFVSVSGVTPHGWQSPGKAKAKETVVEWGIGSPNASPALTETWTPAQMPTSSTHISFRLQWVRWTNSLPSPGRSRPAWNDEIIRDSAAAAGVPSRNNVFEYGFPAPDGGQPRTDVAPQTNRSTAQLAPSAGPTPGGGFATSARAAPTGPKWSPSSQVPDFPSQPPSNLSYPGNSLSFAGF